MKRVLIATAGALALAAGSAWGGGDKTRNSPQSSDSNMNMPSSTSPSTTTPSTTTPPTTGAANSQVSGDVKSTDAPAMAIIIVLPSGDEQNLSLSNDASITRDGKVASLDQVKEGDQVRASFDPSTHKATSLEVKSKDSSKAKDDSQKSKK
jgi:hypothetical protein